MRDAVADLIVRDGVAVLTLRRAASGNAVDRELATRLAVLLEGAAWDGVDALVLRSNGATFSVGGDLREMANAPDRAAYFAELVGMAHRAIRALAAVPVPVIAVVDGAAAGAGLALALLADFVLAGDRARFVAAYARVGLTPDCGTSWLLPRVVGPRHARRLTLLNDPLGPDEAAALGIATHRVASEQLTLELGRMIDRIRASSRPAIAGTKRLLAGGDDLRLLSEHLDRELASIVEVGGGAEAGEKISAFFLDSRSRVER